MEGEDSEEREEKDKRLIIRQIEQEMKQSYIDYAMSVIVGRALPDARDGLKPVHRRVLFGMHQLGMFHNKPFKKSARIVGEVLGKFHPHGDSAVYESLVRMAQDFSLRYPLIEGQGNFGSVDGDAPAAMRYTEARLARTAEAMLEDIDKETVDFVDNFDGSLKEPVVLPSMFPNLIVNGSSGIAVGMATSVPPNNLREVCDAIVGLIKNPDMSVREVLSIIKGPDFPTGGIIMGRGSITHAYTTGRGRVIVRAKTTVEEKQGKSAIIINELPYLVNKALLIEQIARLVREKRLEGISDLRDESDKEGMRVVIELKRDASPDVVLNNLLRFTRMQDTFPIIILALVNNSPVTMGIKRLIEVFIAHRREVVKRRTEFKLRKAKERLHIVVGLIKAIINIDRVVALIKGSSSSAEAKSGLINDFGLSEIQAQAVLDMKLSRLTGLESEKLNKEKEELEVSIREYEGILSSEDKVNSIIIEETLKMREMFGDERRTEIVESEYEEIETEDLIDEEQMIVTVSREGYVKRTGLKDYKQQNRGGVGITVASTKEDDFIERVISASTHSYLLVFTDRGKVHWVKVFRLPEGMRYSKGRHIENFIELEKGEKAVAFLPLKEFKDGLFALFATRKGVVKKTRLADFSHPRRGGIRAIILDDDDRLVNVIATDGSREIIMASHQGKAVRFKESQLRTVGRSTRGVRGMRLRKDDYVIGVVAADPSKSLLTITENGFGKRSRIVEYRLTGRGGTGVTNIRCTERNGRVVSVIAVDDDDQVIVVSRSGNIIRFPASTISLIGRNTQGVRIIRLRGDDKVVYSSVVSE